ncbi:MAG: hypothetical protein Kow0058_18400 [Roseovarius sp.]
MARRAFPDPAPHDPARPRRLGNHVSPRHAPDHMEMPRLRRVLAAAMAWMHFVNPQMIR